MRITALIGALFGLYAQMAAATYAADAPGDFDLYVLSLSWSPEYCAANPDDEAQCGIDRRLGLVVHGLWPQFETERNGSDWPSDCPVPRLRKVPSGVTRVYPTEPLFRHEWREHGSCSGLTPGGYLEQTRRLHQRFQIPAILQNPAQSSSLSREDLRQAVLSANPLLPVDGFVLACRGDRLSEIRLCFTKATDGSFRPCPATVREQRKGDCPSRIRLRSLP